LNVLLSSQYFNNGGVGVQEYGDYVIRDLVLRISELDQGIKQELSEIGTAMRKIMVCDRRMNEALSRLPRWQRFIWDLNHGLAGFFCRFCRSDKSPFYRLNLLYVEKVMVEAVVDFFVESADSLIKNMVEALNEPMLKDYLAGEYLVHVDSLSGDFNDFRLEIRRLTRYSSEVPRIVPNETDMSAFMEMRKNNPADSADFLKLSAYLKLDGRRIDQSIREDAERKRARHKEEQRAANEQFAQDINSMALSAALKGIGIDPSFSN